MSKIIGNTTATPNPRPDWLQTDETKADYIKNKPTVLTEDEIISLISDNVLDAQIQSDWGQTDDTSKDFIKNKPTLGAIASKDEVAKADLASDVQVSLDKADKSVQYTENGYVQLDDGLYAAFIETGESMLNSDGLDTNVIHGTKISDYDGNFVLDNTGLTLSGNICAPEMYIGADDNVCISAYGVCVVGDSTIELGGEKVATEKYVDNKVASLVDSAPETLDTLNELADALGDDPNFATTVATEIGKKVDKIDGKGLSTNDFTNEYKTKVDNALPNTTTYAGSDTVGGVANSAQKLQGVKLPTVGESYMGYYCKFANAKVSGPWAPFNATFVLQDDEATAQCGILRIKARTGSSDTQHVLVEWLSLNDEALINSVYVIKNDVNDYSFYIKSPNTSWLTYRLTPIHCDDSVTLEAGTWVATINDDAVVATSTMPTNNIHLSNGATGSATLNTISDTNINVYSLDESYLTWGSQALVGNVSPVDAAASSILSANRFQFANPAGIEIEYSTDGGSTWLDYEASDKSKIDLVSCIGSQFSAGKTTTEANLSNQIRVTFTASTMYVYTALKKILINMTTPAHKTYVLVERSMNGSSDVFVSEGAYRVDGWSGWNSIPFQYYFGGSDSQTGNVAKLRFTFYATELSSYNESFHIYDIIAIGDTYWAYPSIMAKTGHLYSYDHQQNATFPANVKATDFLDDNGNSLSNSVQYDEDGNIFIPNKSLDAEYLGASEVCVGDYDNVLLDTNGISVRGDNAHIRLNGRNVATEEYANGSVGLNYDLSSDGTYYSVTGIGTCTDTDVVIPKVYNGLPVKEIAVMAFDGEALTSITIPNSIISIHNGVFNDCADLTTVNIPNSVTSIGNGVFNNCENLRTVTVPESVTSISDGAFYGCTSLTSVTIGNGVTSIGYNAFAHCNHLTTITIPDSITSIGEHAFYCCSRLENIAIPSSVTFIDSYAFEGCEVITIYCEATSEPDEWGSDWNDGFPVVWGASLDIPSINDTLNKKLESVTLSDLDITASTEQLNQLNDYDTSKGTIEQRLASLGFKDGSANVFAWDTGAVLTSCVLKRQGNIVYGKIKVDFSRVTENATTVNGVITRQYTNYNESITTDYTYRLICGFGVNFEPKNFNYSTLAVCEFMTENVDDYNVPGYCTVSFDTNGYLNASKFRIYGPNRGNNPMYVNVRSISFNFCYDVTVDGGF